MEKETSLGKLQDEQALFLQYQSTKDKALLSEIMETYSYITEILSRRFVGKGLEYDDIYQSASIGLMHAAKRFDPARGVRFVTFATPTILGEIKRLFRDKGNCIRVPRRLYEIFSRANKLRNEELVKTGKLPDRSELSQALGISVEQLAQALYWGDNQTIQSLEQPVEGQEAILADCIGMEDNEFLMIENRDFVESFLKTLSAQEQEFVKLRFYEEMTQTQIAQKMNTSQMNISRMEKKVLAHLRGMYTQSLH
ncbi:MAG: sigma-70 family RNA polymerase sigma factor [Ruminococcaceae bacterium]|nr:sigma-70 family RNA polymerase sigma factor [Oscillospiraceae bacterium]